MFTILHPNTPATGAGIATASPIGVHQHLTTHLLFPDNIHWNLTPAYSCLLPPLGASPWHLNAAARDVSSLCVGVPLAYKSRHGGAKNGHPTAAKPPAQLAAATQSKRFALAPLRSLIRSTIR